MQACRDGHRPYVRLDILHRENLEHVLAEMRVDLRNIDESELAWLNMAWHRLDPWPDVVAGLTRLKTKYIIAPASNGNIALMVGIAKRSGLPWDAILGAEVTQAYKPTPPAYTRMPEILGLRPEEVCMAAAFIARPGEHGPGQTLDLAPTGDWDIVAQDFKDLASKAGC
jgi:2-haloacid dehalogenase